MHLSNNNSIIFISKSKGVSMKMMDNDFYLEGIKREQSALARKMGDIFSCVSSKYSLLSFVSNVLSSDTFYEYFIK